MDARACTMVSDIITEITSGRSARLFRQNTVLLGLGLLLASCTQSDGISTVTCDGDPEGPIAVTTELIIHGKRTSITGYLNSWGFSLGSIVRISSGSTRSEAVVEWQRLPMSAADLIVSPKALPSVTPLEGFEVHLDDVLKAVSQRMGIDLGGIILKHTILYMDAPKVRLLSDVAGLLNRSPRAVERIRNAPDTPLAIVSGTIDSRGLGIFDAYQTVGVNTFELDGSYVHVSYACHLIKQLGHRASGAPGTVPVIIYLTPIRYDDSAQQVVFYPVPLDLLHGRDN